jgi:hypothetical protein
MQTSQMPERPQSNHNELYVVEEAAVLKLMQI